MSKQLQQIVSSCRDAVVGGRHRRGLTRWHLVPAAAALSLLILACTDRSENPVAPLSSPSATPVFGQSTVDNGTGACLTEDTENAGFINNVGDLNCTSQDLDIAIASASTYSTESATTGFVTLASTGGKIQCEAGDTVWVNTAAQIQNHANQRYDVGLWIGELGGSAKDGTSCLHFNLVENSNGALDLDHQTNDSCGDVEQNTNVDVPLGTLKLLCVDGNPAADTTAIVISACAGWLNSVSPGTRDGICPVPSVGGALGFRYGTTPETTAKCKCSPLSLPLDIRGSITIIKNTVGGDATFAFTHDVGTHSDPTVNSPFNITTVSGTGQQVFDKVEQGTYHVTESAPPSGWSFTSLSCSTGGSVSSQTATITLAAGANVTCTFTNTKIPTLKVDKICSPTTDTGLFNLRIDNSTAGTGGNAACGGTTGFVESSVGGHTVSETAGTSTVLSNYTAVIGGDCAADGSVTLAAGDAKTCTITNTRKPTLRIDKVCVPTTDGGKFNLRNDGANWGTGADAACGGTTGVVVSSIGPHTISETAGTGTNLADYASLIGGDCAADGTITLSAGQNAVCTITNTKKATLRVDKVCLPTNDGGKFNLRVDGSNFGTGADASCGGTTGAQTVTATSHTVSETAGTGTNLSNYTSVIGGDCAADGSITLAPGDNKVCTITNTRLPRLTITKACVPTDDGGKFNLRNDGANWGTGADASCGSNTGAVNSTIGPHTVSETAGTGTSLSDYDTVIGGDCAADGSITLAAGDNKTCSITNSRLPNLTVRKIVKGTGASFAFTGTGDGVDASFNLAPATDDSAETTFSSIAIGTKSVTETLLSGYVLTDLGCSKGGVTYDPLVTQTVSVDLAYGDNVVCRFINQEQVGGTTRTQGFWSTHPSIALAAWNGGTYLGNTFAGVSQKQWCDPIKKDINTQAKLMGGFWSNIAKTTSGSKRSSIDQARMQLVQQLLAALLNESAFNSHPSPTTTTAAIAAYCGNDITAIKSAASAMASFNESGDSGAFTPGESANAKFARQIADLAFWNILP